MAYWARSPGSTAETASLMLAVFIVSKKLNVDSLSSSRTPAQTRLNLGATQMEMETGLCNSTQHGEERQGAVAKKMGQKNVQLQPKKIEKQFTHANQAVFLRNALQNLERDCSTSCQWCGRKRMISRFVKAKHCEQMEIDADDSSI
jgi:hypothetical protein